MVATTHIKHDTKAGRLDITLTLENEHADEKSSDTSPLVFSDTQPMHPPGGCAVDRCILKLVFEDAETGAWFDGAFTHDELCAICLVFHMVDEIAEILAEVPTIVSNTSNRAVRWIVFKYMGKKREYLITMPMKAREYAPETRDVVELRAENSVLRKKVAALDERFTKLEKICEDIVSNVRILAEICIPHAASSIFPRDYIAQCIIISKRDMSHLSHSSMQYAVYVESDAYEQLVHAGMNVNGISPSLAYFICSVFKLGHATWFYNQVTAPIIDQRYAARFKFMIKNGLDMEQKIDGLSIRAYIERGTDVYRAMYKQHAVLENLAIDMHKLQWPQFIEQLEQLIKALFG